MRVYYGDIHNHCGISYGHGPLEDALANARQQLDFCSVTGHAHWPDMPHEPGRLDEIERFHREGFAKLARGWDAVQRIIDAANEPGRFVTFLSFEIHNCRSGDHTVYYRDGRGELLYPDSIAQLKEQLRQQGSRGVAMMAIPHHIGYAAGSRGINWSEFTPEFSPVVEMISMHGCAECDDAPRPYLHTMGPRDGRSSMRHGLAAGHVFGVVGSTDHHSGHPGSYGHGRLAVWAEELSRESIWEAIQKRRTYALTGDRISLDFRLNGKPMGAVIEQQAARREISVDVCGGAAIDYVELVRNNRAIARRSAHEVSHVAPGLNSIRAKVVLEMGWGHRGAVTPWDLRLGVDDGQIESVEPRFRGGEVVAPTADEPDQYAFSRWEYVDDRCVRVVTRTKANPNTSTNGTQAICLEVTMPPSARIWADFGSGRIASCRLKELLAESRCCYLGGFGSPAYRFAQAAEETEYHWRIDWFDTAEAAARAKADNWAIDRDVYYVRVCQSNGQWAWSSPIWICR